MDIETVIGYLTNEDLQALPNEDFQVLLDEVKAYANDQLLGPNLAAILNELGPDANPRWLYGEIIETAYDRDLIDEIDQEYIRRHVGL